MRSIGAKYTEETGRYHVWCSRFFTVLIIIKLMIMHPGISPRGLLLICVNASRGHPAYTD